MNPSASRPGRTRGDASSAFRTARPGGTAATGRVSRAADSTRQAPRPTNRATRERERMLRFRGGTIRGDYGNWTGGGREDRVSRPAITSARLQPKMARRDLDFGRG